MLIEDVACPVDKLADMTVDLGEMFQRHGYPEASCFGHALEGNLHLIFSQVRSKAFGSLKMRAGNISRKREKLKHQQSISVSQVGKRVGASQRQQPS